MEQLADPPGGIRRASQTSAGLVADRTPRELDRTRQRAHDRCRTRSTPSLTETRGALRHDPLAGQHRRSVGIGTNPPPSRQAATFHMNSANVTPICLSLSLRTEMGLIPNSDPPAESPGGVSVQRRAPQSSRCVNEFSNGADPLHQRRHESFQSRRGHAAELSSRLRSVTKLGPFSCSCAPSSYMLRAVC